MGPSRWEEAGRPPCWPAALAPPDVGPPGEARVRRSLSVVWSCCGAGGVLGREHLSASLPLSLVMEQVFSSSQVLFREDRSTRTLVSEGGGELGLFLPHRLELPLTWEVCHPRPVQAESLGSGGVGQWPQDWFCHSSAGPRSWLRHRRLAACRLSLSLLPLTKLLLLCRRYLKAYVYMLAFPSGTGGDLTAFMLKSNLPETSIATE